MTAFEIRLLAYIGVGLGYTVMVIWATLTLDNHHWERITAAQRLAQQELLGMAQMKVIEAQNAQKAAEKKVEIEHEARIQADATSRAAVLSSLRGLEAAVSRRLLPTAVANPGAVQAAVPSSPGSSGLAILLDRFNQSIGKLIESCQKVDADRTAIIKLEPPVR